MVSNTTKPPSNGEGGQTKNQRKEPGPIFPDPVYPSGGPKRLVFPESQPKQKREHMPKPVFPKGDAGPKPLGFKTPPAQSPTPGKGSASSIGRPVFAETPKPVEPKAKVTTTAGAPQSKATPPKALFAQNDDKILVESAVRYVQEHYSALATQHDRIEKQIRQLSPLKMDVLVNWGSAAIKEGAAITSSAARLIKAFSELGASELIQSALDTAKGRQTQNNWSNIRGLVRSLLGDVNTNTTQSVVSFKPRLIVLKAHLVPLIPQIESHIHETKESELRLLLNMASLVATCEVMGRPSDAAMDRLMHDRRAILSQASNQSQLVNLQLVQTRETVTEIMSKTEQMLSITIPAFEMAHATR